MDAGEDLFPAEDTEIDDSSLGSLLSGISPCDDCRYRIICDEQMLACWSYAFYLSNNTHDRWPYLPRQPAFSRRYAESEAMNSKLKYQRKASWNAKKFNDLFEVIA